MVTFTHTVALRNDNAVCAFYETAHIGLQFRTVYLAILMDSIDLTVVVKEHAEVVDVALHVMMRPRAVDILCGVTLQTLAVDVREDIELSVGVADSGCPDTLTVYLLMVLQGKLIVREIESVKAIADILPVYEVPMSS